VCLTGRIHSKRDASGKLIFYDLIGSDSGATGPAAQGAENQPDDTATMATEETALTTFTKHSPKVQLMATLSAHDGGPPSSSPPAADPSSPSAPSPSPADPSSPSAGDLAHRASFHRVHRVLRRGDVVFARGRPQKTKTGELSLVPSEVVLLAPCWREIPIKLTDPVRARVA
jgi:hypothetical protein